MTVRVNRMELAPWRIYVRRARQKVTTLRIPKIASLPTGCAGLLGSWMPGAGIEHVLEVRLQLPPAGGLDLIRDLDERFAPANRERASGEERGIAVERGGAIAHLGNPETDADGVVNAGGPRQ
jgi:hypothetical protein